MDDTLKQIGQRLKGLREVLDIPVEEIAALCETSQEHYLDMEEGQSDPSVSHLSRISKRYGIALDVLLFGEEPRMRSYFLTRHNQGMSVERRKDYKYQSLAAGFREKKMEPFLVQVDPKAEGVQPSMNSHEGQEFDVVLEGILRIVIDGKAMTLNPGDSIYFDATQPHCMCAVGEMPVKFICVVA